MLHLLYSALALNGCLLFYGLLLLPVAFLLCCCAIHGVAGLIRSFRKKLGLF